MTTLELIRSDVEAITRRHGKVSPFALNLLSAVLYRLGHQLRAAPLGKPAARALATVGIILTGAEIDPQAEIGPGLYVDHTVGVIVGLGVTAGRNLTLYGGVALGSLGGDSDYPILGDDVTVYAKASVLGRTHVGDGAVVGAHSLVLADVPAGAVARGTPARSF